MRGGGRDTGGRVNRRFGPFEEQSPRALSASHSQPPGDELSPDFAKALTSNNLRNRFGGVAVTPAAAERAYAQRVAGLDGSNASPL